MNLKINTRPLRQPIRQMDFQGLPISIENDIGGVREGEGWRTVMLYPYGYIRKTTGVDGDHVDCYVGPNVHSDRVFVVHQKIPGKVYSKDSYDEDKVMLGFSTADEAKKAYLAHYDRPDFFGDMTEMGMDEFKSKVFTTKDKPKMIKARAIIPVVFLSSSDVDDLVKARISRKPGPGQTSFIEGFTGLHGLPLGPHEGKREEVKNPGSRGGTYYKTDKGEVRYGHEPENRESNQGGSEQGGRSDQPVDASGGDQREWKTPSLSDFDLPDVTQSNMGLYTGLERSLEEAKRDVESLKAASKPTQGAKRKLNKLQKEHDDSVNLLLSKINNLEPWAKLALKHAGTKFYKVEMQEYTAAYFMVELNQICFDDKMAQATLVHEVVHASDFRFYSGKGFHQFLKVNGIDADDLRKTRNIGGTYSDFDYVEAGYDAAVRESREKVVDDVRVLQGR